MAEYKIEDLILDRQSNPRMAIRYEVIAEFVDGHRLTCRKYATEREAWDACRKIQLENARGYSWRGVWIESHLIRCTYRKVQVPTYFRPK